MDNRITFLVVEDNDLDVEKFERGLARLKITNPVVKASNGMEALELLRDTSPTRKIHRPYIIFLDLKMPLMDGFEFLTELRADSELSDAIVYVMTTSDWPKDIEQAYRFNIAGYIVKPFDREEMMKTLETLDAHWTLCKLPA